MIQKDEAPAEDLSNVKLKTSKDVKTIGSFHNMGLKADLIMGISAYGFDKPTYVQQLCIKPISNGHNVIIRNQSGTTTLCISMLQSIDTSLDETQVLCLSPTRDLAEKVQKVIFGLGQFMKFQCNTCIGGRDLKENRDELPDGPQIISGTPGRVLDMIENSKLCTSTIKLLVLNGDLLLKYNLRSQVDNICQYLPSDKQVVLRSATLNQKILEMTTNLIKDPILIYGKRNSKESRKKSDNQLRKSSNKPKTRLKYLKTLSKPQLIKECLQTEKGPQWRYMPQLKVINAKVRELSKAISNYPLDIERPWVSAAAAKSTLSDPASMGAACQPIDSLREKSKSSTSQSSSSSNEDGKEKEGVVDNNGQLPPSAEIIAEIMAAIEKNLELMNLCEDDNIDDDDKV